MTTRTVAPFAHLGGRDVSCRSARHRSERLLRPHPTDRRGSMSDEPIEVEIEPR